ncbi:ileal sodium/bile acid cotransporter-like [Diadema antillarum]|uniref:ileal sodium/bile acid cotransporter-like n=1 Tax=Diadema antillarum TaxID=105358 RepID=UPI003A8AD399
MSNATLATAVAAATELAATTLMMATKQMATDAAGAGSHPSNCHTHSPEGDHHGDAAGRNDSDHGGGGGGHKNIEELKLANKCILGITLGLTMVAMGAAIELKDFKVIMRRPIGIGVGLLCQVVLMPLIGFIMALILDMEMPFAIGNLITASCPGGTTSNIYTFWTDGDICLSVIMTTISTLFAMVSMPLNLFIYSRRWTDGAAVIPYTDIVVALICIIGPVAIGMLVRWKSKKWATLIGKPFGLIGMLGIIVSIFIISYINPRIWSSSPKLYLAAFAHLWIGWGLGYGIARMCKQPHKQSRTIAFETGAQHVGLALALIAFSYEDNFPLFLRMIIYPMIFGPFSIIFFTSWTVAFRVYRHFRPEKPEENEDAAEDGTGNSPKSDEEPSEKKTDGADVEKGKEADEEKKQGAGP